MAHAAPLAEDATASGGVVPQPSNCPAGGQQDEHCLPGGLGSTARPGGPIHPPVTPPVTPPPTIPPSGRPQATRPQDPELPLIIFGWAKATFHIQDDDHDVIYTAYHDKPNPVFTVEKVPLTFLRRPRTVQDIESGNTQYILAPVQLSLPANPREEDIFKLHVIWKVEGREFDCTVKGKAIVPFPTQPDPNFLPPPNIQPDPNIRSGRTMYSYLDPTDPNLTAQPAYGYLNVVGPDGGDFHSVMIKAFSLDASLIKTCPGNPPLVTKEYFQAGFLLHILWQKNTYEDGRVIFKGQQTYDQGNPLDFLNLLPPGAAIPEEARQALQASGSGTSLRYTWEWELVPVYTTP